MKRVLYAAIVLFGINNVSAQVRVGFENNSQWYIDDKKIKLDEMETDKRFRSNSYLKADYDYKNWSFGAQLEGYEPKALLNYSPELKDVNIGTIYARYNNRELGLDVTAGHFYDQFGSGLLFRSWEDRQLGINNSIFGLNLKYDNIENFRFTLLGGKQRIGMGFDLADSFILGGDVHVDVAGLMENNDVDFTVAFSYLGRFENSREYNLAMDKLTSGFSGRANFGKGGFYIGAEYVYKTPDGLFEAGLVAPGVKQAGNALLINTGYSQKGLGFDINLRRMENMGFYSERSLSENQYLRGTLNYIPALTKQYDYSLQNIYVYQSQPFFDMHLKNKLGEMGGQFDFFYEFEKGSTLGGEYGTNVVVNGSYWAGIESTKKADDSGVTSKFFEFGKKYYSDFGLEVRKRWSKDWSSIFMYLNQYYNSPFLDGASFTSVKTNIVSAESTYQFMEEKSVRLELQHLWTKEDKKNWLAGTLEFAYNANWSVFVSDMYNYGNDYKDDRVHYYNFGMSYTKGATRISGSYGRQRGGLLCVGGVCRYVPEAAGLTVGITTSF